LQIRISSIAAARTAAETLTKGAMLCIASKRLSAGLSSVPICTARRATTLSR